MPIPGRLEVNTATGHVTGPAVITYNTPWPCPNGRYGSGKMSGVIMHTMVGNLPGTIATFNNPARQASAHFGIDQAGNIHQFGPVGKGWIAWAQEAGNDAWYSIEHADNGSTANPLTTQQVTASAQLVEVLSRFAGFPLQVTDSVNGTGYGTHVMGGAAWGGHTCPGPGPRAVQRSNIINLAKQLRAAGTAAVPSGEPVTVTTYKTTGRESLFEVAAEHKTSPSIILRLTLQASGGLFPTEVAGYLNAGGNLKAPMAAGISLRVPA
jgi:hypothetical protein